MIKLSDYVVKKLEKAGVKDVFMISGGGAMHLNDSFGKSKEISYYCNHHEQASAIGAEGYARATGKMGVVCVTTGPGGTNTVTGVIGQWLDSVPVLYISGQVKYETTIDSCKKLGLRQLGDQEINIVDIVKPITKFAEMIKDPLDIDRSLSKAIYLATHGRPGPVWLDIPLNIQGAMIDEKKLSVYDPAEDAIAFDQEKIEKQVSELIKLIKKSERPVILAGHGIRIAKAEAIFSKIVKKINLPVVTSFNGADLLTTDSPQYIGHNGTIGQRAGNFAVQNSDLLISIGTRNNIRQISYNWPAYARGAVKVAVDIDEKELKKPTLKSDLAICSDAKDFLEELDRQLAIEGGKLPSFKKWLDWCIERKKRYPTVLPEYRTQKTFVQPYHFIDTLTSCLDEGDIIITGNGTASVVGFQAGIVKKGQRHIWNSGCAAMGYDLSAAIGASIGLKKKRIICLAGDGSLQMNIQELQTLLTYDLPVKVFYLNNSGYISIKQTQDALFQGHRVACCSRTGVCMPDISKIAKAYGLSNSVIKDHKGLVEKIQKVISTNSPEVCDVVLGDEYKFMPKTSSMKMPDGSMVSKPLEDMFPFLPRDEFAENMIIPMVKE